MAAERKTSDERKEILARQVSNLIAQGRRVESQSDYQAILVIGRRVNHTLHLILSLITCSFWGTIWIALVLFGGERREIATVDEWGNVAVARMGGGSGKLVALIALGILLSLSVLIALVITLSSNGGTGSSPASVPATPEPAVVVNAEQIWNDYLINETAANLNWKGKRLLVTLDAIGEIESGGRVRKDVEGGYIELDFTVDADVIDLTPGESVRGNCKLDGFELDSWLKFSDCKKE